VVKSPFKIPVLSPRHGSFYHDSVYFSIFKSDPFFAIWEFSVRIGITGLDDLWVRANSNAAHKGDRDVRSDDLEKQLRIALRMARLREENLRLRRQSPLPQIRLPWTLKSARFRII